MKPPPSYPGSGFLTLARAYYPVRGALFSSGRVFCPAEHGTRITAHHLGKKPYSLEGNVLLTSFDLGQVLLRQASLRSNLALVKAAL
jgi:hypothetical protein